MSNKQVILIFAAGILLLLGAFWAGLSVTRKGPDRTAQAAPPTTAQTTTPAPPAAQPAKTAEPDPEARYFIVVAVFGTEEKAKELTAMLRKKNYWSTHFEAASGGTGTKLFRVIIGPYDERDKAERVANELSAEGRKGIKIEKSAS
ncbi:MAG TPA: SPOR domain-containing protein [Blastocatellia bacterium]|nr:SPOR domain-containing protein [Blastocatellia bacterium]